MHRRLFVFALTALAVAFTASPALGHQGNGDYRSELDGITPAMPGVEVEVLNYDDSLQLRNGSDETVTVLGYEEEPYVRIAPDGSVAVNRNSPALYLNDDRYGNAPVPESADAGAEPDWEVVDRTGQYVWHDHRIHYMSTDTPAQVTDESKRTKIFDYEVPIEVDAQPAVITGTLFWVGESGGLPAAPFVVLGVLILAGIALLIVRRRRSSPDTAKPIEAEEAW
jgi:hypothetical protein